MTVVTTWQQLCEQKKAAQASAIPTAWRLAELPGDEVVDVRGIPRTCGLLTESELEITELDDVDALLRNLAKGTWSAVSVTTAYLKRALIAHQLTNCLTEFWIEDALQRAKELDEIREKSGPVGLLHGLPISLKDQFHVKGKELNMGIASWIGRISKDDAALVKILVNAGAVIYTRTNVPQTLMKAETGNHVYGTTVNPRNRKLTPGGSSGGEGALIAMKGSPLGVGTDIGGSVRIPSGYNGLYGIRPTSRRVPYEGAANTLLGLEAIESSIGPLARDLNGCAAFLRAVMAGGPGDYDPKAVEIPWRESHYNLDHIGGPESKLAFAFYDDDGVVRGLPPVRRGMAQAVEALRAAGHDVIPWKPDDHEGMVETAYSIFAAGAVDDFTEMFKESGETPIAGIDVNPRPPLTVHASWKLTQKRDEYRRVFLRKWLNTASSTSTGRPIDALLCPMAPWPAPPLEKNVYPGYTMVYNLLDVPGVIIPVTTVDSKLDIADTDYKPRSDLDASYYKAYSPEEFANSPVALQIIGRRWREEEILGIARAVDRAVN